MKLYFRFRDYSNRICNIFALATKSGTACRAFIHLNLSFKYTTMFNLDVDLQATAKAQAL